VSLGGAAATEKVVFFVNYTHMWSFLSINWVRWSLLPKILQFAAKDIGKFLTSLPRYVNRYHGRFVVVNSQASGVRKFIKDFFQLHH
jgi:hypothetical protein